MGTGSQFASEESHLIVVRTKASEMDTLPPRMPRSGNSKDSMPMEQYWRSEPETDRAFWTALAG